MSHTDVRIYIITCYFNIYVSYIRQYFKCNELFVKIFFVCLSSYVNISIGNMGGFLKTYMCVEKKYLIWFLP